MPNTDTATGVLREEHELILEVSDVLETILDRGKTADALDVESVGECVAFLRLFADACHHGKEEDLLFPALESQGMPHDQGPIAVMLEEHRRGRAFVRQMAGALDGVGAGDSQALEAVHAGGRGFIELIRGHILKENHVLFNLADGMLAGPPCQQLCEAYSEVCRRRFEGRTLEDLRTLATHLQTKYPSGPDQRNR